VLAIAESLLRGHQQPEQRQPNSASAHPASSDSELLTLAEVAAMTRLAVGTLRYWRHAGSGGPQSVKLGRRVMYRRADVEKWLDEAH
jgi:predicted DNA-binding transcriptional regulator AlpA